MARRSQSSSMVGPILLIVGLVVGIPLVILMICGGVFIYLGLMARNAAVEVANNMPPIVIERPGDPFGKQPNLNNDIVPNALPQPPAPAGIKGKTMVDLIPLINAQADAVHGRWAIANNALHCNDAHFVPRIQIPYQPPREYDFIVVFSQPGLRNGISMVMPNPAIIGNSFFWYLGSEDGSAFGFQANPDKSGRQPGIVKANTIVTTTVQVRANGVKGFVNGKLMLDHPTDFRDLTCDNWRDLRDKSLLAVACDDPTVFHHVRLVEITGKGKKMR
jgi:hypothetical protein